MCVVCDAMAQGMTYEEAQGALFERVIEAIHRVGWNASGIMASECSLPFTYTSGLTLQGKPELIIVGIDPRKGHATIADLLALDQPLEAGREYEGVLVGYKVRLAEVTEEMRSEMSMTRLVCSALGDSEEFSALQIQWPDREGRFPGDPGCESEAQNVITFAHENGSVN